MVATSKPRKALLRLKTGRRQADNILKAGANSKNGPSPRDALKQLIAAKKGADSHLKDDVKKKRY